MFVAFAAAWLVHAAECNGVVKRATIGPCTVAASYDVKAALQAVTAARSRLTAALPVLPSNPQLDLSLANRQGTRTPDRSLNWYVTLRQELEIAGQRGQRMDVANASIAAEEQQAALTARDVAVQGWQHYFDALAADQAEKLAIELVSSARFVEKATRAAAEKGSLSPLDGDVARAARIRIERLAEAANRRAFEARTALSSLLLLPSVVLEGDLTPLRIVDRERGPTAGGPLRPGESRAPELQHLAALERAELAQASLYRRLRAPNPTLSAFAQNDGFDERVFGIGLSFPIPLPQPLGRTHEGQIAESEALAEKTHLIADRTQRDLTARLAIAQQAYHSRQRELAAFDTDTITRAHKQLTTIAQEIAAGRIAFRDASLAQQALVDLLLSELDAKLQVCLASVTLARAANLPLETGAE